MRMPWRWATLPTLVWTSASGWPCLRSWQQPTCQRLLSSSADGQHFADGECAACKRLYKVQCSIMQLTALASHRQALTDVKAQTLQLLRLLRQGTMKAEPV